MISSKLGIQLSSSVLTTALALAPVNGAWAAPPPADPDPGGEQIDVDGSDAAEGETTEVGSPESEAAAEQSGDAEAIEVGSPEGEAADAEAVPEQDVAEGDAALPEAEELDASADEPDLAPTGPVRPLEPTWGPKDQYPRNGKGMLITGGIVTALGAAFIATSVIITRCDFDSGLECRYGDQRDFLIPTAVATTGLGLLLVGIGVGNRVKYKRWENWTPEQTAVVPTYVPGGGGLAWVGRF